MKFNSFKSFLNKSLPWFIVFVFWEIGSSYNLLNNSFFSAPTKIIKVFFKPEFWLVFSQDVFSSLTRLFCGLFLGYILANLLIFVGFYSKFLLNFFKSINNLIRYLPIPVIIPLAILAFGLTDGSKILVITFSAFVLYFTYLIEILEKEEKNYKTLQISLHTKPFSRFKDFFWPLSNFLNYRISTSIILWCLGIGVISEIILGGKTGLGIRLLQFQQLYQTDFLFAYIFLILLLSISLENLLLLSFNRFKWDYLKTFATIFLSILLSISLIFQGQNFFSKNIFVSNKKKIVTYSAVVNLPIYVYLEKFNSLDLEIENTGSGVQAMDSLLSGKTGISGFVDMPNAVSGISSKNNLKILAQVNETPTWPSLYLISSKDLSIDDFSALNGSKVGYYPNNPIIEKGLDLSLFIKKVRTPSIEYVSSNDPTTLTQALVSDKAQAVLTIEPFASDSEDKINKKRLNPNQTLIAGLNFEKLPLAGLIVDTKQFSNDELVSLKKGFKESLEYIRKNTTTDHKATPELQEILKKYNLNTKSSLSFWEDSLESSSADLEVLVKLMQTYKIENLDSLNSENIKSLYLK